MKSDIEIAQEAEKLPIEKVAEKAGIPYDSLELYGKYKAKLTEDYLKELSGKKDGKLVLVTAINPTPAGEGKTTTTIGLVDALNKRGKKAVAALREPSLGPCFGIKGGAAGGGYAQVVPMEELNLHFTGDFHAITSANNLLAAMLDNHIQKGNKLGIDPRSVVWKRCMDMNDRVLRNIVIGLGKKADGMPREDHFVISVASEVMAVFCLANNLHDLKERLKKIIVAYNLDGDPVTAEDLKATGAMAALLVDALKPNIIQTLEHNLAIVHGGPFANIAHGCNSVRATRAALKLGDIAVTEAGFGADLGAEKFFDIKCRTAGLKPDAVVIVATVRALKMHGGVAQEDLEKENVEAMLAGASNLEKHIDSISQYHVPYIVAINKFAKDTPAEVEALLNWCREKGYPVEESDGWAKGGEGTKELASHVVKLCEEPNAFAPLYDVNDSIENKISLIAQKIYGADGAEFSPEAEEKIAFYKEQGWDRLPICMAKTQSSLSDNPDLKGRPTGFVIHVRDLSISKGAGFIVAYTGSILTMPGLPKDPAALHMGIDENGNSYGIF